MQLPRLDILLYAHDGRGLGHASRTIAIGMALRRLAPTLRVLFVSGLKTSQELIGPVGLDWLKLPSYETEVAGGVSRGVVGNSRFDDRELGELRAAMLAQLVELYRPRLALADHTPQGKHRELIPALARSAHTTRWLLGVRGVVGEVAQARSALAGQVFAAHYRGLFWYGDSAVLGEGHLARLAERYRLQPIECGYVSRLRELRYWQEEAEAGEALAGVISVPWLGEHTLAFLHLLAEVLALVGAESGRWRLFIGFGGDRRAQREVGELFGPLSHCRLEPLSGSRYLQALAAARTAVIYGGYNSVMDVLAVGVPALVVLREMRDNEQQRHLEKLLGATGSLLQTVAEHTATATELAEWLQATRTTAKVVGHSVNLDGAERAARLLLAELDRPDPV